jgi:hypothetical protein
MEQTAVEWFYEEIWKQFGFSCSSNILEKAKEMEKEQIIKTRQDIYVTGDLSNEQYYNQTFKQD